MGPGAQTRMDGGQRSAVSGQASLPPMPTSRALAGRPAGREEGPQGEAGRLRALVSRDAVS